MLIATQVTGIIRLKSYSKITTKIRAKKKPTEVGFNGKDTITF